MQFENKTAIFSGAASGLGYLSSKCFVEQGGSVVMCDINADTLNKCVDEINAIRKGSAIGVLCDVRDYRQIKSACDEAVKVFGSIDLVASYAGGSELRVLSAGNVGEVEFPDVPIEVYDWSLEVNLRAQLYFAHAALGQMRSQKSGVIITVGSVTGDDGCEGNVGYSTSKSGAMYGLTKSLAQYGAKYGIRCCCITPGPVLTRPSMANMKTALGRAAEPQEIVDMVMYLASDKAEFITGSNFVLDGGRAVLRK